MNKEINSIVIKLSTLLKRAQDYYSEEQLSNRYKTAPQWDKQEYSQADTFGNYINQQLVSHFYTNWLKDIEKACKPLSKISSTDYSKIRRMFNDLPLREQNWVDTFANRLELQISNLENAIKYLADKYEVEEVNKFEYVNKTNTLKRGHWVVIEFTKKDDNRQILVKTLFDIKNLGKQLAASQIPVTSASDRWLYTAVRDINSKCGVELIKRQRNETGRYDLVQLNPDFS